MSLSLPDPLVVKHDTDPELGEDADRKLSPWGVQRNLEKIAQQFPIGNANLAKPYAGGSGVLTWPGGSSQTGTTAVPHGLGIVPVAMLAVGSSTLNCNIITASPTATTFDVRGITLDGSSPAAGVQCSFYWIALG